MSSHLLSLPDEILCIILKYINDWDKLSVSLTCTRFDRIMNEKPLIRCINFSAAYDLKIIDLKHFFRAKLRCSFVTVLNITSCYWLSASDIITFVVKLKQLVALYAADTQLLCTHLTRILPPLKKLERLSISCNTLSLMDRKGDAVALSNELGALKFLFVCVTVDKHGSALASLTNWLMYCSGLEEFWLISQMDDAETCYQPSSWPIYNQNVHFPNLHTCVIEMPTVTTDIWVTFIESLLRSCLETQWKKLWLNSKDVGNDFMPTLHKLSGCDTLCLCSIASGEYRNLKQLFLGASMAFHIENDVFQLPRLENLCLADLRLSSPTQFAWLEKFTGLHSLAFLEVKISDGSLFKAVEQLHKLSSLSFLDCEFQIPMDGRVAAIKSFETLTTSIRGLKKFELSAILTSSIKQWTFWDKLLPFIANWTQLTKLAVDGLMIVEDTFLLKISTSCPDMENISISNLGAKSLCKHVPSVCKALQNWKKLKDFRFVQSNIALLRNLIVAVQSCPTLERVAIIDNSRAGVLQTVPIFTEVVALFRTCTRLIFLYLSTSSLTTAWKNRILEQAKAFQQQGLLHENCRIYLESQGCSKVPWIHRVMVDNRKQVSLQEAPGTWYYPQLKFS